MDEEFEVVSTTVFDMVTLASVKLVLVEVTCNNFDNYYILQKKPATFTVLFARACNDYPKEMKVG